MKRKLLSPLAIGDLTLKNRVIMAPLTRSRAGQPGDVPTPLNALYYAQRASAGLIVTEATQISRQGQGYAFTPGMYTDEQEHGWKKVVEAVIRKAAVFLPSYGMSDGRRIRPIREACRLSRHLH